MWKAWNSAIDTNDTRALTQLASPGSMLNATIDDCAYPNGLCVIGKPDPPIADMYTIVPPQSSYPLYFLASIRTTGDVTTSSGLNQQEPWMALEILTKATSAASWRLSFDSGYAGTNGGQPAFLPFDLAGPPSTQGQPGGPFNPTPTNTPPIPVASYLPRLASYWQSFKDTGSAPTNAPFVIGGGADAVGQELAENRQGSVYNGSRQTYHFAWDAGAGVWQFSSVGGFPMECGSVLDESTLTPVSGLLLQNFGRIELRRSVTARPLFNNHHEDRTRGLRLFGAWRARVRWPSSLLIGGHREKGWGSDTSSDPKERVRCRPLRPRNHIWGSCR